MNIVKKIAMLLLAVALVLGLAACGTGSSSSQADDTKIQEDIKTEKTENKESKNKQDSQTKQEENTEKAVNKAAEKENETAAKTAPEEKTAHEQTAQSTVTADKTQSQPQTQAKSASNNATVTQPKTAPVAKPKPAETVTISIIGPENKRILSATKVEIKEGDTVLDVLLKIAEQKGIEVDYKMKYGSAYVEGIDGYYEGDYPGQSGWTYKLNGVLVQKSAGDVAVKSGDTIVWEYVGD